MQAIMEDDKDFTFCSDFMDWTAKKIKICYLI